MDYQHLVWLSTVPSADELAGSMYLAQPMLLQACAEEHMLVGDKHAVSMQVWDLDSLGCTTVQHNWDGSEHCRTLLSVILVPEIYKRGVIFWVALRWLVEK